MWHDSLKYRLVMIKSVGSSLTSIWIMILISADLIYDFIKRSVDELTPSKKVIIWCQYFFWPQVKNLIPQQYHILICLHSCHVICWLWRFYQKTWKDKQIGLRLCYWILVSMLLYMHLDFHTKHRCDNPIASADILIWIHVVVVHSAVGSVWHGDCTYWYSAILGDGLYLL